MKIKVSVTKPPPNWHELGGIKTEKEEIEEDDGKTFFVQKRFVAENLFTIRTSKAFCIKSIVIF